MGSRSLVVVGDAFVDRDLVGKAERLVPDAPVPVVEDCAAVSRPGGAALAALMAAADGDDVTLICALGRDETGRWCADTLAGAGVRVIDCSSDDETACKMRVRAGTQIVARIDRGGPRTDPMTLPEAARGALDRADAVLVSDYGRGMTGSEDVRAALERAAVRRPLVWDPHPKGSPAVTGARLLTPNAREAATLCGAGAVPSSTRTGLAVHVANGRALARAWGAVAAVVTLGEGGAVLVDGDGPPLAVPAPRAAGGDPCGAGDRFAVRAAQCLGRGALTSEAVHAAVDAASHYVARGGVASMRPDGPAPNRRRGDAPGTDLVERLSAVRKSGGVVVAAGGCFDLLHVGHTSMLHAARALGDFLVVCINSDASVRALKGDGRPIVGENDRAALVGALADVDAVVLFDEPTPEAVLERLRPDVFVKGADYAHRTLPEEAVLERWGGQVVVVPYVSGRSTSTLIAEMTRDG